MGMLHLQASDSTTGLPAPLAVTELLQSEQPLALDPVVGAEIDLPRSVLSDVEELASKLAVAPANVLCAALLVLLRRYTDHAAPGVTVVSAEEPAARMAADLKDEPSFLELLERVRRGDEPDGVCAVGLDCGSPQPLDPAPALLLIADLPGATLSVAHEPSLLHAARASELLDHYRRLLIALVERPEVSIAEAQFISDEERQLQVVSWNMTDWPVPDRPITRLIEDTATRRADAVAVSSGGEELSYGELEARANRLAHHLSDIGVGPDHLVGVCVDRSVDMLVALLGVLKSGGAYVPLDPTYPRDRLTYMLEDSGASVLITDGSAPDLRLPDGGVVHLEQDLGAIGMQPSTPLDHEPAASDLAYVIYTSGSTGRPKGVAIEHRSLSNLLASMIDRPGLREDDVLLSVTTPSFDIHTVELYLPLLVGARVEIAGREVVSSGSRLAGAITRSRATVLQATPATWKLLVQSGWQGEGRLVAWSGGEAMSFALIEQLLARCAAVWNLYGPTETTVYSTGVRLEAPESPAPIGRPIANTSLYILDQRGEPVAVGAPGELHIGGRGVARGYLHRPDLTAERFVPDPFAAADGARMYRTGDLARQRADGTVELLGRLDHQVKIRGYRIELGEVESALSQRRNIADNVVVARENHYGDLELVAYVVPSGPIPGSIVLRRELAARLPGYMVPSAVVALPELPLTPNGKVDRNALPAPPGRELSTDDLVAPRNEIEAELVEIWERVLGVAPISVTDSFFDLGVTSLMTGRLFAEIQEMFGTDLPLAPIFQAPTIEELAKLLTGERQRLPWRCLVPLQPHGSRPPLFCVHGAAGTVYHLRDLALAIGDDQPFFAVQGQNLYGGRMARGATIESMAATYLEEIQEVQPEGPYHLLGYCLGATIAFEMAQQLLDRGEEAALVASLNGSTTAYLAAHRDDGWRGVVGRRQPLPPRAEGLKKQARVAARVTKHRARVKFERLAVRWLHATGMNVPTDLRMRYFHLLCDRAEARYVPRPYPGSMMVISGEGLYPTLDLGWSHLVQGELACRVVPNPAGDRRGTFRQPGAAAVAAILRDAVVDPRSATVTAEA